MGFHPANLGFRFVLEILSLVGLFRWGLSLGSGVTGWMLGAALTITGMVLWATFRVPGDRSAKGEAPVAISGRVRLVVELAVFGFGAYGWFVAGPDWMAWIYLVGLVVHHLASFDRLSWLWNVPASG